MAVLSDVSIRKAVQARTLGITNFDPGALQPATYDLRLHWRVLVSPKRHEEGRIVDLRKEPEVRFYVEPGRFVGVLTYESFNIPLSMAGRFGLRSEFTRQGLVAFGGIQIDPGFRGRLAISLFHAGPEPVHLQFKRRMFTVEFCGLDEPASFGYKGEFQNQRSFPEAQKHFILNAHTTSLAEINSFPKQIAGIETRMAQHEGLHHPSLLPPPSVQDLAKAQGVAPIDDLSKLAGGWPDDDDIDEFHRTVREWRGQ
jgi:dCTP deaminase